MSGRDQNLRIDRPFYLINRIAKLLFSVCLILIPPEKADYFLPCHGFPDAEIVKEAFRLPVGKCHLLPVADDFRITA